MVEVTWQGTDAEFVRLQEAAARNCDCVSGMLGLSPKTCAVHQVLANQIVLDHLLYVYRTRRMFITREFYAFPMHVNRGVKANT
jgi:hypothetical protein